MQKWIRRGFNILTLLVMLAAVTKHPGQASWFVIFGLAGFNAGWWLCAKHAENTAKLALMGALRSNRPVRVTRWIIPPQDRES